MKSISLILISLVLMSCGKNSSSSHNPVIEREERQESDPDSTVPSRGGYIDTSSVGTTELLNVTLNETASLSGDRVTFFRPAFVQDKGMRISCTLSVNSGDIWHLRKSAADLELELPDGTTKILKPISRNSGITGNWVWSGKENGIKVNRRYYLLPDRIIINQDCEG